MKNFISICLIFFMFSNLSYSIDEKLGNEDFKLILSSQNMREEKDEKIDINKVSKSEMLSRGIASSYCDKIIDYRDITGGFTNISELKRIKGIGEATYQKLTKKFKIVEAPVLNKIYINSATDKELVYFGFTKKEIKKLRDFTKKNGRIINNIDLKKVLSRTMYEKLKDRIKYEERIN